MSLVPLCPSPYYVPVPICPSPYMSPVLTCLCVSGRILYVSPTLFALNPNLSNDVGCDRRRRGVETDSVEMSGRC